MGMFPCPFPALSRPSHTTKNIPNVSAFSNTKMQPKVLSSLCKQIFQIFLAAPCFPLPSCKKGSKMFFPLGTSSGIN